MTALLDIADASEVVKIRGVDVKVHGITMQDIAALMRRFPEIYNIFSGDKREDAIGGLLSGDALPAVISAGTHNLGNEAVEEKIRGLYLEEQVDLLRAILKMTMPGGVVPFVEKLTALGALVSADTDESDTVSATKLRKRSAA